MTCDTPRLPLVDWEPVHAPLAWHVEALVEDQVSIALCPAGTLAGEIHMWRVGAGVPDGVGVPAVLPLSAPHAQRNNPGTAKAAKSVALPLASRGFMAVDVRFCS